MQRDLKASHDKKIGGGGGGGGLKNKLIQFSDALLCVSDGGGAPLGGLSRTLDGLYQWTGLFLYTIDLGWYLLQIGSGCQHRKRMLQSEAHIHENSSGGSDDNGSDALYSSAAELSAFD